MGRLLNLVRRWWWRREWIKHALGCRQCTFAAEAETGVSPCEEGGMVVTLAGHYAALCNGKPGPTPERKGTT